MGHFTTLWNWNGLMFEIGRTNSTAKATPLSPRASLAFVGYLSCGRMNTFHSPTMKAGWILAFQVGILPTPLVVKFAFVDGQTSAFDWSTHHVWLEKPVFWLITRSFEWCKMNLLPLAWSTLHFLVPPNRIRPTSSISSVAWNRVQTGYVPNKPKLGWRTHEDRSFCLFWGGFQSRNATARVSIKKCKRSPGIFHLPSHLIMFQIPNPIQDHPRLPGSKLGP